MPYMNKAIIMWHLVAKPELKQTATNDVANICIVTNEKWKDASQTIQEKATFHNVTLWWQSAKYAAEFSNKGDLVLAEWKIANDEWIDESWNKRFSTKIIASSFSILRNKQENHSSNDPSDDLPI